MSGHRARLAAACAAAALVVASGAPSALEASPAVTADATTGGGYEWNLNHAADVSSRADSAVARAGASVVIALLRGRLSELYLDVSVDGTAYAEYDDLSSVREAARLGLIRSVGQRGVVHVSARGGLRQYRDDERNAVDLAASASYRHRLATQLAAGVGYAIQQHDATVDAYDSLLHRGTAGVYVGGWTAELGVHYALERADTTLYMADVMAGTSTGRGRQARAPSSTFAEGEIAYREQTVGHVGELDLVLRPRGWLRLGGSYRLGALETSSGWVHDQAAAGWLRLRW